MVSGDRWDYHTCNDAGEVELEPGQFLKYLPQSIVFISKYPFFTTLKDCLSKWVRLIHCGSVMSYGDIDRGQHWLS